MSETEEDRFPREPAQGGRTKEQIEQQLLVIRARRGERDAMEHLVRMWESRLFYYLRRLTDQEADAWDVLQNVWLRVFRGIDSLERPEAIACWLYTLARNTAFTHNRVRNNALAAAEVLESAVGGVESNDVEFELDNAEAIHHGLTRISAAHREVLTLFFLNDLSVAEIGKVVGVSEGTVKSRLHYARLALRKVLESEGAP